MELCPFFNVLSDGKPMGACLNALVQFDRNLDGQITISDLFGTASAIVNFPVGFMLDGMESSAIYGFLELSSASCRSNTSLVISVMAWGLIIYAIVKSLGYSDERARQDYEDKKRDMGY
jgi:hypothetical protein